MKSRIYSGHVSHARHTPVGHRFRLPYYFYAFDLSEYEQLTRDVRGFSVNKRNLVSLRERDYLSGQGDLRAQMLALLEPRGCAQRVDRIVLITMARFLGNVFNPVSFYYCLDTDGAPVAVIAEVNNTFRERHLYVLTDQENEPGSYPLRYRHDKQFHVSPFNDMAGQYEFSFSEPEASIDIVINLIRDGRPVLNARMQGQGRPLTTASLWKTLARYPFIAALTVPRILWQAAMLYYRRHLPIFHKPEPTSSMTMKVQKQ